MNTDNIINQLLVNLMINNPDYPWTEIISNTTNPDYYMEDEEPGFQQIEKYLTQNKKHILILINTDDQVIYPSVPEEESVPVPLSDENYLIEDITFSIYWD